jgi:hypothetical protein
MGLLVLSVDIWPDMCGLIAWVDLPGELMPGLIKYNENFSLTLEWEE